ncbi:MAG: cellulose-binding protein [Sporichthyaceae bacterium]|nr:cellulose-binding protein [Sporichthyaceae bacterium]
MSTSWSPRNFDVIRRGYAPQQVDETFAALVRDLTTLRNQRDAAQRQLAESESRIGQAVADAEQQQTYRGIGDRIERILRLAEEEADDLRTTTAAEIDRDRNLADQQIDRIRDQADVYAKERRAQADAEAASILEAARREAETMLEDAERTSRIRKDEAENLFELNRGKAAQAAADFEITLSRRRDQAERDFTSRMEAVASQLAANEQRSEAVGVEVAEMRSASERKSAQVAEAALAQADDLVRDATARAARIRSEAERELASMVQRRDSINLQLTNVRQMLATLTGSSPPLDPIALQGEPEVAPATTDDESGTDEGTRPSEPAKPADDAPAASAPDAVDSADVPEDFEAADDADDETAKTADETDDETAPTTQTADETQVILVKRPLTRPAR